MSHSNGFGDIYYIIWFLPNTKSVGEVRNYAGDLRRYRRIGISVGNDILKKMNRRFLMTEWATTGPKIRVSTAFMTIPRSQREAGIWHEVGHIHYNHRGVDEAGSQTELGTSSMISSDPAGTRQAMEEAADRFAVLQSGKEALKGFLEHLLRTRPSGNGGWSKIERRELEARIASIRGY